MCVTVPTSQRGRRVKLVGIFFQNIGPSWTFEYLISKVQHKKFHSLKSIWNSKFDALCGRRNIKKQTKVSSNFLLHNLIKFVQRHLLQHAQSDSGNERVRLTTSKCGSSWITPQSLLIIRLIHWEWKTLVPFSQNHSSAIIKIYVSLLTVVTMLSEKAFCAFLSPMTEPASSNLLSSPKTLSNKIQINIFSIQFEVIIFFFGSIHSMQQTPSRQDSVSLTLLTCWHTLRTIF